MLVQRVCGACVGECCLFINYKLNSELLKSVLAVGLSTQCPQTNAYVNANSSKGYQLLNTLYCTIFMCKLLRGLVQTICGNMMFWEGSLVLDVKPSFYITKALEATFLSS